jgi:hypothetical protein
MEDRALVGTNSTAPSREHRGQVTSQGLLQWPLTSSDPNGLLSGESEKSKRFHPRNVRTFYPQILRKSHLFRVFGVFRGCRSLQSVNRPTNSADEAE